MNRVVKNLKAMAALALIAAVLLMGGAFYALTMGQMANPGVASAEIVGNPEGATERYLIQDGQTVRKVVYVAAGAKTMANTTPVAGAPQCGLAGTEHRADVMWSATMTGTAPTLTIVWQNSIDGGTTWADVGTWTAYNATSNPATQTNKVSDIPGGIIIPLTTPATVVPAIYGDCWRAVYTFGGSGTVTANFKIVGIEK